MNKQFIPDEEIILYNGEGGKEGSDLLNTSPYVDALTKCIESVPEKSPFTIGLYGEWGCGKSSILATLKERLTQAYKNKYRFVTYDAWKYSQDSFRRMFLFVLQEQLGVARSDKMDRFYDNINEDIEVQHHINWFWLILGLTLVIVSIIIAALVNINNGKLIFALSSGAAILTLILNLIKNTTDDLKLTAQKSRLFAPEQFEECYQEIIKSALNQSLVKRIWTKLTKNEKSEKIIVIIDNIDRCPAQQTQEMLTTVKSFMGNDNVIFIIPVAVNALIHHIVKSSSGETDYNEANEYLRKFFNVALWIKPFRNDEMYDFTMHLVKKYDLKITPTSISIISREYATNPRRIIQLLNNYIQESSLYDDGFLGENESMILICMIIREEFPQYYEDIVINPYMLLKDPGAKDEKVQANDEAITEELKLFWSRTKITILSYRSKPALLDRILSNSNVFGSAPTQLKDAIESGDVDAVKDFLANKLCTQDMAANYIKYLVNKAVTRNIETDVTRYVETICKMNAAELLTKENLIDLANLFENKRSWKHTIGHFENLGYHQLIDLALKLRKLHYLSLYSDIKDYLDLADKMNPEKKVYSKNVIDAVFYLCSLLTSEMLDDYLLKSFDTAYKKDPSLCFKYQYAEAPKVLSPQFCEGLFKDVKVDNIFTETGLQWQVEEIFKQIPFDEKFFNNYVDVLTTSMYDFNYSNNNASDLLPYVEGVLRVMEICKQPHIAVDKSLTTFVNKVVHTTNVSIGYNRSERKNIINVNLNSNDILEPIVEILFNASLMCGKALISQADIELLINNDLVKANVMNKLKMLLTNGISIDQYENAILDYNVFDDASEPLLKYLLGNKEDSTLRMTTEHAKNLIDKLCRVLMNGQDKNIEKFIADVTKNTIVANILIDVAKDYTNDDLLKLPTSIQKLIVKQFEIKIDDFKDNLQVLTLIAQVGSAKIKHKLIDIITEKLVQKKSSDAVQMVLTLQSCNKSLSDQLITTLRNNEDIEDGVKENCIEHLKSISR